ncbi:unnamed protein product [Prunus armeniaca]
MAKHPRMILYLDKVQELLKAFPTFTIQQVPRAENAARRCTSKLMIGARYPVQMLHPGRAP